MVVSEATTATKLSPLMTKHHPVPTVAIRSPATAGPDGPCRVDQGRVEAHRIAQVLRSHHLQDERLTRGVLEAVVESEDDGQDAHVDEGDPCG